MREFVKTEQINLLLETYAPLLTSYQKDVMQLYFQEDWSLAEIAESKGITRNAVFTLIRRVSKKLDEWEHKLGIQSKHQSLRDYLHTLKANQLPDWATIVQQIENILNK